MLDDFVVVVTNTFYGFDTLPVDSYKLLYNS